ncbi:MAG TPA: transposase [Pyrinomonadaceae bacterium]|jgi:hypothetical protein
MISTINYATTIADESFVCRLTQKAPNLHYHFVFRTQTDLLADDWRERLYRFIAFCVNTAGAVFISIDGTNRAIMFRVRLPSTFSPDEFARRLKILSANWLRRKADLPHFLWLEDYEAVTLDPARMSNFNFRAGAN